MDKNNNDRKTKRTSGDMGGHYKKNTHHHGGGSAKSWKKANDIIHKNRKGPIKTKIQQKAEKAMVSGNYREVGFNDAKHAMIIRDALKASDISTAPTLKHLTRLRLNQPVKDEIIKKGGVILIRVNNKSFHYIWYVNGSCWMNAKPINVCSLGVVNVNLTTPEGLKYKSYDPTIRKYCSFKEYKVTSSYGKLVSTGLYIKAPVISITQYMAIIDKSVEDAVNCKRAKGDKPGLGSDEEMYPCVQLDFMPAELEVMDGILDRYYKVPIPVQRTIAVIPSTTISSNVYTGKSAIGIRKLGKELNVKSAFVSMLAIYKKIESELKEKITSDRSIVYVSVNEFGAKKPCRYLISISMDGDSPGMFIIVPLGASYHLCPEQCIVPTMTHGLRTIYSEIMNRYPYVKSIDSKFIKRHS